MEAEATAEDMEVVVEATAAAVTVAAATAIAMGTVQPHDKLKTLLTLRTAGLAVDTLTAVDMAAAAVTACPISAAA